MIKAKRPISPEKALMRLEDLCARSEQCTGEARKKMATWGLSAADADKVIASLVARRYIDDRRFCSAFVRDKLRFAHWGRRKISLALYQKRVDRNLIVNALDEIDNDEYTAILKKIVLAKAKTISDAATYEGRTKLFRFAVSRGFEPDLIASLLRSISAASDD